MILSISSIRSIRETEDGSIYLVAEWTMEREALQMNNKNRRKFREGEFLRSFPILFATRTVPIDEVKAQHSYSMGENERRILAHHASSLSRISSRTNASRHDMRVTR